MKKIITILCVLSSISFGQARKAEFLIHDRGNLWETMKDDGTIGAADPTNRFETYPSMDWPGGPNKMEKDNQRSYMLGAGIWMGGFHSDGSLFFTENGPFQTVDKGLFQEMILQNNFIENEAQFDPNEAEQIITASWTTSENISVVRKSRTWSLPEYNNFIIIEYTIENKNANEIKNFFAGFPYLIRPSYQDFVVHNGWGDDYNRTDDSVKYDPSLQLLYSFDDTPNYSLPGDVGNYWEDKNELRTTGYAGYSLLYADNNSNGKSEPANILYAQLLNNERFLTSASNQSDKMYKILSGEDRSLQAENYDKLSPFMMISVGPYNLKSNEKIKIVIAEAVDGLDLKEAMNGLDAQEKLIEGENLLKASITKAKEVYNANYKLKKLPPPSPNLEIIPVPERQSIAVRWDILDDDYMDPLTSKNDLLEYHIYRCDRSFIGPYEMIKKVTPTKSTDIKRYLDNDLNKWVYEDYNISLGVGYFYGVTSVDSSGNESWITNRNESPVYAAKTPAPNALNVKVFPNPFRKESGFPVAGSENSIVWSNLPEKCTIRVYTSSGELVVKLEHDNPNSGEETWKQLSDARQRTAPGIYFWTVESEVGNAKGTLLIIK